MNKSYAEKIWGNCSEAVAYSLRFSGICYTSKTWCNFFKNKCEHREIGRVQIADFIYPKSSYPKSDFYVFDIDYENGISERVMKDMVAFGVDEANFRPVHYSRNENEILGYQINPVTELDDDDFYFRNGYVMIDKCDICNCAEYELDDEIAYFDAYNRMGYPTYISEDMLSKIGSICRVLNEILISKELYEYLIVRYPKLQCQPVFIGDVRNDREYLRLHNTEYVVTGKMKKYTVLYHISATNDKKFLGVFEHDKLNDTIQEYMQYSGFDNTKGFFILGDSIYSQDKFVYILTIWNKYNDKVALFERLYQNDASAKKALSDYSKSHNMTDLEYELFEQHIGMKYFLEGF